MTIQTHHGMGWAGTVVWNKIAFEGLKDNAKRQKGNY